MSIIVSLITSILQTIVNLLFMLIDFVTYVTTSVVQMLWQNFNSIVINYTKRAFYSFFRASYLGYRAEEGVKKVGGKLKKAGKRVKRLSSYDKSKIKGY